MIPWRRVFLACACVAAVLLVPRPASAGFAWDVSAALGYAASAVALLLFVYPLRRAGLAHRRLFTVTQHRRLGWLALILTLLHVLLLLLREPLTLKYLLPSAPLYMLCGTLALIALAVLVPTGLSARRALRRGGAPGRSPRLTALTHAALSAVLLGLIGAHLIGSGQLVDRIPKMSVLCIVLALAIAWSIVQPRWQGLATKWLPVVLPGIAAILLLLLLPTPSARSHLLEPLETPAGPPPPLDFPHERHREVNCLVCHHNLVDHTGMGSCISCHRESPAALKRSAEATFHVFCRDCHVEKAGEDHKHGPTRSCGACHRPEQVAGAKGP
jgi:Class III cytochrome C family